MVLSPGIFDNSADWLSFCFDFFLYDIYSHVSAPKRRINRMKNPARGRYVLVPLLIGLAFLIFVCVEGTLAQRGRAAKTPTKATKSGPAAEGSGLVRIRKLTGLGNQSKLRTPAYKSSATSGVKPLKDWIEVKVTYDTKKEWLDEVTIKYYALCLKEGRGGKSWSLFKAVTTYVDIEEGKDHAGAVYLRPPAIERYGKLVAVAVEVMHGGELAAEESDENEKLPPKWWKNPRVLESENTVVREGYLLTRAQSPFALISIDDFEFAK
jgi:hypothetical protein